MCGDVFVVVVVIFHVCVFYFYIVIMAGLICFRLLLGWFLCVIFIFSKSIYTRKPVHLCHLQAV